MKKEKPPVPKIENIHRKVFEAATSNPKALNMSVWHGIYSSDIDELIENPSCGTTHCRAGWAIHLAGKAGYDLEKYYNDPEKAAMEIYKASSPIEVNAGLFYLSNEESIDSMKHAANLEAKLDAQCKQDKEILNNNG